MSESNLNQGKARIVRYLSMLELIDEAGTVLEARIFDHTLPGGEQLAYQLLLADAKALGYDVMPVLGVEGVGVRQYSGPKEAEDRSL